MLQSNDVILFQGDSITDWGRKRDFTAGHTHDALGDGYPFFAAAELLATRPALNLTFFNRGIGGNKMSDLAARWEPDALALRPSVVSILIGVNDIWHARSGRVPPQPLDLYEHTFHDLIRRTRDVLPQARFVLCAPFVFKFKSVDDAWFPEITRRQQIVARVARETGSTFIAFQSVLDEALKLHPDPAHWLADGVHPTPAGHYVLARAWQQAVV
jgi:lysophospholipase L1-like esterase